MLNFLFNKKKAPPAAKKGDSEKNTFRLLKNAVPRHYTICFKPNMEDLTFEASVAIDLTLVENSKQIFVNATDLSITKVMWEEDITQNRQEPIEVEFQDRGQFALTFDPFLVPQKGQLRMNFNGKISDKKMAGFYRSKYYVTDHDYNLIAQFELSNARRCMLCYDDPGSKAPFDVCLVVPKGKTIVGNMPIKVIYPQKINPDMEIVEFKRTPPLSTYTLAFVVGSFDYVEGISTDNEVPIRVYTPRGKQEQGKFALDIACKAVPFLTEYFSFPFPMQKLDLIAISNFAPSAVENWGLIMHQESHLLMDPEVGASCGDKQYVSLIVCEEIVKQWLGNLVSIEWWSQLWLKEGMGTFIRYLCMEEVRPDYECSAHFVTEIFQKALRADGYKSTHPIEIPIHSSIEAEELFDEICFKKGAALLRMLYNYIGDDHFKAGINIYLKKYKFKSATSENLWKCFEETSSKPVTALMSNWIAQKGFPLVKITGKQDGKNRFLKLTQQKFSTDPTARDDSNETNWMIPITVTSERDPSSVIYETLMETKTKTIAVADVGRTEWLKLNPGGIGFYRVRYPQDMMPQLVHAIRDKSMEPVDRLNFLEDQFALLLSGLGTTIDILTLLEAFIEEDDYNVWCTISYIFDKLMKILAYVNFGNSVRHYGRYMYNRVMERVGFKFRSSDHHHQTLLRALTLRMMVKFRHVDVMNKCEDMYQNFLRGDKEIPADLKYVVYNAILSKGDDEDAVKAFTKLYRDTESLEDKDRIANAFGSVSDLQMIKYILDFAVSDDVRKQDTVYIMIAMAKNRAGRDLAWSFFRDNFILFKNRYGPALGSKLVKGLAEDFASEEKAVEVAEFFKANIFPGTDRAVQEAMESIHANSAWLKGERNPIALQDYLEADAL